ncbi:hypothetical protein POX_f07398 [Penicillium oxalicum]|uniref:hypothetical protein n=1 Tax=Penicillium oxalicum TaxID=69781 RepID=UPI0020B77031|nr:hypothetical protein POX_f07398 [Penicillium oxalicum]KAI2787043.1 hypothetical protein POX_f07398 [Penicillium oxalicum]
MAEEDLGQAAGVEEFPASREDYSKFFTLKSRGQPVNQLTGAPKEFTLNPLELLERTEDFEDWFRDACQILKKKGLHRLVDPKCDRPKVTSDEAETWVEHSHAIQIWLQQSISKDIDAMVKAMRFRCEFADEYVISLKKALHTTGFIPSKKKVTRVLRTYRADYPSAIDFVHEFRSAYTKATEEVQLAPGMIVSLLLDELQSDIPTFVAARLADYSNRYENIAKITAPDLFRTFTKVIHELEIVNYQFSSVTTTTTGKSSKPSSDKHEYLPLKHMPPRGKSPWEWAKEWTEGPNQVAPNGNCFFCGRKGHATKDCAHLVITSRTPDWKPVKGIWVNAPWRNMDNPNGLPPEGWTTMYNNRIKKNGEEDTNTGGNADNNASANMAMQASEEEDEYYYALTAVEFDFADRPDPQLAMASIKRNPSTEWIVDSGASRSICVDGNAIVKFQSDPHGYQCQTSDGRTVKSLGKAIARIELILQKAPKPLMYNANTCQWPTAKINHHKIGEEVYGDEHFNCEACKIAKSKRIVSHTNQTRSEIPWEFIHIDIQPCTPLGIGNVSHVLIVVDDATRFRWAIPMKTKGQASDVLIQMLKRIFTSTGTWPSEIRTDGDRSFFKFKEWAEQKGCTFSISAPYTHEQNGVAESSGHLIMQGARTLMVATPQAPAFLWPEAVVTTAYIMNRIRKPNEKLSPLERWNEYWHDTNGSRVKQPIDLGFLRIWYSKAYVHIPKEQRTQGQKMAPRAWIGYLVGYDGENGHQYRIYDPCKRKVMIRRDVDFWEEPSTLPLDLDDRIEQIMQERLHDMKIQNVKKTTDITVKRSNGPTQNTTRADDDHHEDPDRNTHSNMSPDTHEEIQISQTSHAPKIPPLQQERGRGHDLPPPQVQFPKDPELREGRIFPQPAPILQVCYQPCQRTKISQFYNLPNIAKFYRYNRGKEPLILDRILKSKSLETQFLTREEFFHAGTRIVQSRQLREGLYQDNSHPHQNLTQILPLKSLRHHPINSTTNSPSSSNSSEVP